ncbi:hypothetical protein C4D60_Mb05t03350 [Musa balbisiana]|uniref:Uncharacterized protein n=1 Tax=Musa balbisiana TaxID=52838 RepID=A0A4S8JTD6_MUSBA|nr:hypothetical protein C4D60_Mb05t03350 [Musa balbisiana]
MRQRGEAGIYWARAGESRTDERFDQIRLVALEFGQLVGPRARRGPLICHWAPMLGRKDRNALLHRVVFPLSPSIRIFRPHRLGQRQGLGFLTLSPPAEVGVKLPNFRVSCKGGGQTSMPRVKVGVGLPDLHTSSEGEGQAS